MITKILDGALVFATGILATLVADPAFAQAAPPNVKIAVTAIGGGMVALKLYLMQPHGKPIEVTTAPGDSVAVTEAPDPKDQP